MPIKTLLHRFQPAQLYIVLILSIAYCMVQLGLSHASHSLTLLVQSYHMMCNIIALTGRVFTNKHSKNNSTQQEKDTLTSEQLSNESNSNKFKEITIDEEKKERDLHEKSLRNTFGWTRIDILTMLIVCVFLASLCFSLLVEAIQTLIHIDHQDTMHHGILVLLTGGVGFIVNGIAYLLIGGYTFHQGSLFQITSAGDIVLDRENEEGEKRLNMPANSLEPDTAIDPFRRQTGIESFRDICSTLFVILCSIIVITANNENVTKFVDPLISIVSCILLLVLSYPYMKESCLILLQTIPGSIDIEQFRQNLLKSFSDIVNVHDLHIWQLTGNKYVSTAHIIFQNPCVYSRVMDKVVNYFHEQGITIVTIQPEFYCSDPVKTNCMVKCIGTACVSKYCCQEDENDNKIEISRTEKNCSLAPNSCHHKPAKVIILDEIEPNKLMPPSSIERASPQNASSHSLVLSVNRLAEQQMRQAVSDSNIPKTVENRQMAELGPEFEDKLNIETFDLDKIGQQTIASSVDTNETICINDKREQL